MVVVCCLLLIVIVRIDSQDKNKHVSDSFWVLFGYVLVTLGYFWVQFGTFGDFLVLLGTFGLSEDLGLERDRNGCNGWNWLNMAGYGWICFKHFRFCL